MPQSRHNLVSLAFAAIGACAFGSTILFGRMVAKNNLGPLTALGVRFAIAGVLLVAILVWLHRPVLPPKGERFRAVGLGLFVYAVESTFFFAALERGTAAAVALIFYSYPAVVTGVELATKQVQPRRSIFVALTLCVAGACAVAVAGGDVTITPTGVLCVMGSIAMFSIYVLTSNRVLQRTDSLTSAAWTAIGAATTLFVVGAVAGELRAPGPSWPPLLASGTATAVAFTLFFVTLGRLGPSRTAVVMTLEAVSAVVLSAIFLGESVRLIEGIGGVAVLAGAVIAGLATPEAAAAHETNPP